MNTAERSRFEALQADRRTIEGAAGWLRAGAWEDEYSGFRDKSRCFVLATLLEALSLQLDRVPDGFRREAVRTAEWLVGGSRNVRF